MATWTEDEKISVLIALGYEADSNLLDSNFAAASDAIKTRALAVVDSIESLEGSRTTFAGQSGLYKRVEDVEFADAAGSASISAEVRRLAYRLALLMGATLGPAFDVVNGGVSGGPIRRG